MASKVTAEIIMEVRDRTWTSSRTQEQMCRYLPRSAWLFSTKSREMIAPGAYAILAPLFVGFFVGPRCLVGMLAGGMVAIMMSHGAAVWLLS